MDEFQGPISKPVFYVELGHTPLLKHFKGLYRADGTRTDAPSAGHTAIESSGIGIIDKAESLMNAAMTTRSTIQHYVHETLDIPPLAGPEHAFVGVLLGAAVGYHAIGRKLKNYIKFTTLPALKGHMDMAHFMGNRPDTLPWNHKREVMSRSLVTRGHATIDELLEASFGEWPVKGLDIYGSNPREVTIKSVATPKAKPWQLTKKWNDHILASQGSASWGAERYIKVNPMVLGFLPALFHKSSYSPTLGHETTHILQGDHDFRSRETFGDTVSSAIYIESNLHDDKKFFPTIPLHMFLPHFSEDLSAAGAKELEYQRENMEMQARLHEVLADGYQRWGSLPQNREQFIIAMTNAGLAMPAQFSSHLQSSPSIEETAVVSGPEKYGARTINELFETLTDEGKDYFWREYMPRIYCDLIEMYGDKQGRERFGYGPNPRYQFNLHAAGEPNTVQDILKDVQDRRFEDWLEHQVITVAPKKTPDSHGP